MANSSNITLFTLSVQPNYLFGAVIATFGLIAILINAFFFTVGLKTLQPKAHNMLAISMCAGGCIYGVSLFMLAVSNLNMSVVDGFGVFCLSQLTLIFISMTANLSVTLMICIERFITIKLSNYGVLTRTDRWKKKTTTILFILTTSYVILCVLFVPRNNLKTKICYLRAFYTTYNYKVIMSLLSGLFVSLAIAVIILYSAIVYMLLRFKKHVSKVTPVTDRNLKGLKRRHTLRSNIISESEKESHEVREQRSTQPEKKSRRNALTIHRVDVESENNSRTLSLGKVNVFTVSNQEKQPVQSCLLGKELFSQSLNPSSLSTVGIWADCRSDDTKKIKQKVIKDPCTNWEVRAIATSAYIITSTLLLHGPMIVIMVMDSLGIPVSRSIANLSAILLALQGLINPFIYTYRFETLRRAMKNIICCKRNSQLVTSPTIVENFDTAV